MPANSFEWTPDAVARLTAMWRAGDAALSIGAALGCGRDSALGKVHRLKLPSRPNPILRRDGDAPPPPIQRNVSTLPSLPSARAVPVAPPVPAMAIAPRPVIAAPPPGVVPAPVAPRAMPAPSRRMPCCWPIGMPRTLEFRFCDAATQGVGPYCAAHHAMAYTKLAAMARQPGDRRSVPAAVDAS